MGIFKKMALAVLSGAVSITAGIDIHGFISQGGFVSRNNYVLDEDSKDGTFNLREMGINFQLDATSNLHIGTQIMQRCVGVYGQNQFFLDWGYGDYRIDDRLYFAAGRVKIPQGLYGAIQDFDFLRPWAMLPSSIYSPGLRALAASADGIQVHGTFNFKNGGNLGYSATIGNEYLRDNDDLDAYGRSLGIASLRTYKLKFNFNGQLIYDTPVEGLHIGASTYHVHDANYTIPATGTKITSSFWWSVGSLQFTADFFELEIEVINRYTAENLDMGVVSVDRNRYSWGGYIGGAFKFTDWFSLGAYYDLLRFDMNAKEDAEDIAAQLSKTSLPKPYQNAYLASLKNKSTELNDLCLTAAFNVNMNFGVKIEGHFVKGVALLDKNLNPNGFENKYQYGVAKVSYNF